MKKFSKNNYFCMLKGFSTCLEHYLRTVNSKIYAHQPLDLKAKYKKNWLKDKFLTMKKTNQVDIITVGSQLLTKGREQIKPA